MSSTGNKASGAKVVLVTGASSGFGMATSKLLARRGYRVYGTSRNPSKVNDQMSGLKILPLDVDFDQSVGACVGALLRDTGGRLDVLVNNAGYVSVGAIEETSIEEAKMQLETNLFGVARMVRAVLPTMRSQRGGQIINIGSLAGSIAAPFQGFYAVSKFAMEGYTEALRHETRGLGIKVSVVEPGFFRTNLAKSAKSAALKIDDYDRARGNAQKEIQRREARGQDPVMVAETVLRIIETEKPRLHYAVGRDRIGLLFKRLLPQSTFEGGVRRVFKLDA